MRFTAGFAMANRTEDRPRISTDGHGFSVKIRRIRFCRYVLGMTVTNVQLNPRLSSAHHRVLLRYLVDELALSHHEWVTLADAVDALGESLAALGYDQWKDCVLSLQTKTTER